MIDEADVREIAGVQAKLGASVGPIILTEWGKTMTIETPHRSDPNELTPSQARKLALYLNRFAKRIENRNRTA
jgi:hypothetical protein